jgi:hypothetical protein
MSNDIKSQPQDARPTPSGIPHRANVAQVFRPDAFDFSRSAPHELCPLSMDQDPKIPSRPPTKCKVVVLPLLTGTDLQTEIDASHRKTKDGKISNRGQNAH